MKEETWKEIRVNTEQLIEHKLKWLFKIRTKEELEEISQKASNL